MFASSVVRTDSTHGIAIDPANNKIKGVSDGGGYALKLDGNIVHLQHGGTDYVTVGTTHSQIPGSNSVRFNKPVHLDSSNVITAGESALLIANSGAMSSAAISWGSDNTKIYRHNNGMRIESAGGIKLYGSANTLTMTVDSKGIDVVGHVTASGNFKANGNIVGDNSTNILAVNDIDALGNITAQGDIIAQRFIVSSSVSVITSSFSSGSTIFGNTADDIHQFTGSLRITGDMGDNISGSAISTGSFGKLFGDGSSLTGLSSYAVANSSNNRVLTSVDSSNGNAEANLTFDGSLFNVVGGVTASAGITAESSVIRAKRGTNYLEFDSNSNGFNYINTPSGKDIRLAPGGSTLMRIQTGKVSIGNANYAGSEALYVQTNIRSNATSYFGGMEIGNNILRPETGNALVISGVNQLHVSGSVGKVGIGTTSADKKLHVQDGVAGMADLLLLDNTQNNNGYGVGILFGLTGVGQGRKGGIFFERTASTARGSLHFSTHDEANSTNVDKTDASLTITKEGNIIVPKGNVSGSSTSTGSFGHGYINNTLGVGTKTPGSTFAGARLDVSEEGANSDARIVTRTTDVTGSIGAAQGNNRYFTANAGLAIVTNTNHPIQFSTNLTGGSATEKMILDTSGNLGIGTPTPGSYYNSPLVTYQASANYLTIATDTDGISSILMADGTSGAQAYAAQLEYQHVKQ